MPTNEPEDGEVYGDYSVDDENQPGAEDFLLDGDVEDEADRGYSPPEKWSAAQGYGNTPLEEELGETLDQRIAQEIPEPDPYAEDEDQDEQEAEDEHEVGNRRSGRLVDPDEGTAADEEKDLIGIDVGIDGAAASAEEAAVHVIEEDEV